MLIVILDKSVHVFIANAIFLQEFIYLLDKSDKYDSRDVERLQQDDKWVENYLIWRHDVIDDTLKMIDESFQWRKEYTVNGKLCYIMISMVYVVFILNYH